MLDHVFTDAIGALRDVLEDARLERLAEEERFQADMLIGDLVWETSYGLPGEGLPPRTSSEVSLGWSAWSQAAYRSWFVRGDYVEPPQIGMRVVFCLRNLVERPEPAVVISGLPASTPDIGGGGSFRRERPAVKTVYSEDSDSEDNSFEVPYEGVYYLDEAGLEDGSELDGHFNALGSWIASTLVRLSDLRLR